ncbi:hypothetical protein nrt1_61510 [Pseudomonas aeruginosa]
MTIRGKGSQRGVSQKEKIYFYYSKSKRQVGFLLYHKGDRFIFPTLIF